MEYKISGINKETGIITFERVSAASYDKAFSLASSVMGLEKIQISRRTYDE